MPIGISCNSGTKSSVILDNSDKFCPTFAWSSNENTRRISYLYKVENLKPNNQYEFRIQYKSAINGIERSDWSPILQTGTTPEPMTGETVFKAIAMPGKDQLEKLLQIL